MMIKRLKSLLREERGQSMVEFAVVLPLLIVLTVGTLYLTISFMHKSRLNGLSYMSARAASVRNDTTLATDFTLKRYREKSGQGWVEQVKPTQQLADATEVTIQLTKPGERLDILANSLDILSGGGRYNPQDIVSTFRMTKEYLTRNGSPRPQTFSMVDYRYGVLGDLPWNNILAGLVPDSIFDLSQMSDTPSTHAGEREKLIGLSPPNTTLKKFYKEYGLNYVLNSEEPQNAGFDSFGVMQTMGENFKALETSTNLLLDVAKLTGFFGPLVEKIGNVAGEMAEKVEMGLHKSAEKADQVNRATFSRSGAGL